MRQEASAMQTPNSPNASTLPPPPIFTKISAWCAYIILCTFLYWLVAARPLVALPWQWADDGLFLQQGERISTWLCHPIGPWLGLYDPVLLAKPPGFGFWLALVHLSGVPLRVAEFALLLPLPFLFRRAVHPLVSLNGWRFVLVTIFLVGVPALSGELRLLRGSLQAATAAATLISAIGLTNRAFAHSESRLKWAMLTGFSFACSYLNREESFWLLPAIGTALLICALVAWSKGSRRLILAPALVAFVSAEVLIGGVCALNKYHYGIFATSTRRGDELTRLYEILTKLEPELHEQYVPIKTSTRIHAYRCSPAFAKMESYLEGIGGDEFAKNPFHNEINRRPPGTREFYGSNFEWALLRAAAHAGATDAPSAERLFGTAANELKDSIRQGKIRAGTGGHGKSNAPIQGDSLRLIQATWKSTLLLFTVAGVTRDETPISSGSPEGLQRMSDLTNTALAPLLEVAKDIPPDDRSFHRQAVRVFAGFLRITLPGFLFALVASVAWVLIQKRFTAATLMLVGGGLILIGSQLTFSVIIAAFDVLATPTLQWPESYNRLGFIPLSVLTAYGAVSVMYILSGTRSSGKESRLQC